MPDGVWYIGQSIDAPVAGKKQEAVHLYSEKGGQPKAFGSYEDAISMAARLNDGHWEGQPASGGTWTPYAQKQLEGMKVINPPARPRAAAETPELSPQ